MKTQEAIGQLCLQPQFSITGFPQIRLPLLLGDGGHLSIQASEYHYCKPRTNDGGYYEFEVGVPSFSDERLLPYAEDPINPTSTVYGWVPIDTLIEVIDAHGGPVTFYQTAKDGDGYFAALPDFVDLQQSRVWFANTPEEAIAAMHHALTHESAALASQEGGAA